MKIAVINLSIHKCS